MTLPSSIKFPKLRSVDVRPYNQDGQPYYLLHDPLELGEDTLLVPRALGPVLALCDGSQEDAVTIGATLNARSNLGIDLTTIAELLSALDSALLLENERTDAAVAQRRRQYRSQPYREPALAGISYPGEKHALSSLLDEYISSGIRLTHQSSSTSSSGSGEGHAGIFSPHIDYNRGGAIYGAVWHSIEDAARAADLAIVVATDHYGDDLFTLTRQRYASPLGVLPTATTIVDELAGALGEQAVFAGELRHIREHSIELVAVWLQHVRGAEPIEIVPVLCGSLHRYYDNGHRPEDESAVRDFLETLRPHCDQRNVLIVASGDLAHVGPAFGGKPLTEEDRTQIQAADKQLTGLLCAGDADGFFQAVGMGHNRYNVCGATPGYLASKLMNGSKGRQIAYGAFQADALNESVVTICGLAFT